MVNPTSKLLVCSISPYNAYGIGQVSVVNSLAFFKGVHPKRVERGAAAAIAQ
ncbi:MAG: hypothetical protein KME06_12505 [Kastovskya adunca ATA6-11-RM4]|nr:hypothetical protein [Kastovskya adunca ATA6-11-RM4]